MKYTAWSVMAIGVGIFAFWGLLTLINQSGTGNATGQSAFLGDTGPMPLLLVSAGAILGGLVMLAWGGRGYFRTNNPAIHSERNV